MMKVLIAGAGVAGLACAAALRRAGATDLTIVERASEVGAQGGTGIAIPPNGSRALAAVGLAVDRLVARGSRLREYRFFDSAGRELSRADLTRLWLGPDQPYFAVHRRRIYEALIEAVGDQSIQFHSTAELAPDASDGTAPVSVRITAPNGPRHETFDLVIGADGIRSTVRKALWPAVAPRPLGWWSWRCVVSYDRVEPEVQVAYSGLGGVFLYVPIGDGEVYVYAACREGEADKREREHGPDIAARFGKFGAPRALFDALAALPDHAFHVGPLQEVPHEQMGGAGRGGVVLVGDALHASSPNMAQGVSLAAEDAVVLAEIVSTPGGATIPERFWQRRLPRIRHVQEWTRKRDQLINKRADSALFQRVSNLIIRWRGADRMQRDAFGYLLDNLA